VLVAGAVAILGGLTAKWWAGVRPAIEARTVQEATFAGEYLDQTARGRQAVFILTESIRTPAWQSIAAALPPDEHARTFPYYGSLAHFLIGRPSKRVFSIPPPPALSFGPSQSSLRPGAVAIVIERFNARVFRKVGSRSPERVIASGVLIARGPLPRLPLPGPRLATANVGPAGLVGVSALVVALLYAAGGGWAVWLLPTDRLLRASLSPALGIATISLCALAWARIGLSLTGHLGDAPLALATGLGWLGAGVTKWRTGSRRDSEG